MSAQITIAGNFAADPELKFTPSGAAVVKFTVVTSRPQKDEATGQWEDKDVTFWNCEAWRQIAENIAESCSKGTSVIVTGSVAEQRWTDKTSGDKKSKMVVNVRDVGISIKRHTATSHRTTREQAPQPQDDPWSTTSTEIPPF